MGICFKYRTSVLRLAFSAGNSGYTDREEYEEENGRKKCRGVALYPYVPLWTSDWVQHSDKETSERPVTTAILLLRTVHSKFLPCLRPISLEEKHKTFTAAVKK